MAEQERPRKRVGVFRLFGAGVDNATRNNVTAYGYPSHHHRRLRYPPNLAPMPPSWRYSSFSAGAVVAFIIAAMASGFGKS